MKPLGREVAHLERGQVVTETSGGDLFRCQDSTIAAVHDDDNEAEGGEDGERNLVGQPQTSAFEAAPAHLPLSSMPDDLVIATALTRASSPQPAQVIPPGQVLNGWHDGDSTIDWSQ